MTGEPSCRPDALSHCMTIAAGVSPAGLAEKFPNSLWYRQHQADRKGSLCPSKLKHVLLHSEPQLPTEGKQIFLSVKRGAP